MKGSNSNQGGPGNNRQGGRSHGSDAGRQNRPQNKDDIDSRSREEQSTKGDDVTHNEKAVHSKKGSSPNPNISGNDDNDRSRH